MTGHLPEPKSNYEQVPAGAYAARCRAVVDLGDREETWKGKQRIEHKIVIEFELGECNSEGEPFTISGWYTWSMSEKAKLRQHLESWRGKPFRSEDFGPTGFHISRILGVPALLTVVSKQKENSDETYAKIEAIAPLPAQMDPPEGVCDAIFVWLEPGEFKPEEFAKLSDGMRKECEKSAQYRAVASQVSVPTERSSDDGAPF